MTPQPPSPAELLTKFLARTSEDRTAGIAETPASEVQPYEAAFAPLVEPRTAWEEAIAAPRLLVRDSANWKFSPPSQWTAFATSPEGKLAVAFAAGNFPQMVKDLPRLVHETDRSKLRSTPRCEESSYALTDWAEKAFQSDEMPRKLVAIGVLRAAGHITLAGQLLGRMQSTAADEWRGALANEQAALLWETGEIQEAMRLWQSMPDSAPACFNRGMSSLFTDMAAEARPHLQQAVQLISDDNAWHHLARLYLTLTEM